MNNTLALDSWCEEEHIKQNEEQHEDREMKQIFIVRTPQREFWILETKSTAINDSLSKEIDEARKMLELDNDWDGEGAVKISRKTWQKALDFLNRHKLMWELEQNVPTISPLHNGSIDLHWKNDKFELLINIQEDSDLAGVYGDDYKTVQIKRYLDLKKTYPAFLILLSSSF